MSLPDIMALLTPEDTASIQRELTALGCAPMFGPPDLSAKFARYCTTVLTPSLHNVLETSAREGSEFSLPGLVKGFNAYKEVRRSRLRVPNCVVPVCGSVCESVCERVHVGLFVCVLGCVLGCVRDVGGAVLTAVVRGVRLRLHLCVIDSWCFYFPCDR